MFMKKIFFIVAASIICATINAQSTSEKELPDQNDFDFLSDKKFNNEINAALLNKDNVFVKSYIGFNLDSTQVDNGFLILSPPFVIRGINDQQDSIVVTQDPRKNPITINGVEYERFFNISFDKEMELVTLDDIKEQYYPEAKGPCMFMVNKFVLTKDIQSYRFDKDFILSVELLSSSEFEAFKDFPEFSIIRIFTKTRKNIKDWRGRLRM